jgi:plasmid maintenance system antidote protein VapI
MSNPDYLTQLIDYAKAKSGSDAKTAKSIGASITEISSWRNGHRTCSPETVALLAEVAGLEPEKWLVRAVLAKYEGTAKGDKLYKALGKALAVTGAALVSSGAHALPISSLKSLGYFIRCILC